MRTRPFITITLGLFAVLFTDMLRAETRVDKQQLQELITGKTLEGKWIMWNTTYKMYLDPSGKFKRIYGDDKKEEGEWWINNKGKLCFRIEDKACRRVKQRDDGGYNLYNKQKELKQTIDKISAGNIFNL